MGGSVDLPYNMAQVLSYRNKEQIKRDILGLVSNGPKKKTHVMYEAKLSYRQLVTFLEELVGNGHLQYVDNKYVLTKRGKEKLSQLNVALAN